MNMNTQKPEPATNNINDLIDLHSVFLTIQGEGPFSGHRAVFVRLAGCNLKCPWCDTEYTEGRKMVKPQYVLKQVQEMQAAGGLVVITGGEPTRQNLDALVKTLTERGFKVQIESNGVLQPSPMVQDYILNHVVTYVVSPKTSKISVFAARHATCFKYVLEHAHVMKDDGLPGQALGHTAKGGVARPDYAYFYGNIYVNPMDAKDEKENLKNLDTVIRSCMLHGHILGIQLHKLLNME